MCRYFRNLYDNNSHFLSWKSKRLSDESINPLATSDNSLALSLNYIGTKARVKFEDWCLK